jgi:hypothetical protein
LPILKRGLKRSLPVLFPLYLFPLPGISPFQFGIDQGKRFLLSQGPGRCDEFPGGWVSGYPLDDNLRGQKLQEVTSEGHKFFLFQGSICALPVKLFKPCSFIDVKGVDLDAVGLKMSYIPGRCDNLVWSFSGKADDDVDADMQRILPRQLIAVDEVLKGVAPVNESQCFIMNGLETKLEPHHHAWSITAQEIEDLP